MPATRPTTFRRPRGEANTTPPASAVVDDPPGLNDGNINDVLARVGDDKALAAEALGLEQLDSKPRKSLIEALEGVING